MPIRDPSGYLFYINNNLISQSSKKQPTVALSSYKAEYIALTQATKECIQLIRLLAELGYPLNKTPIILEDNQSAIALANNLEFYNRVKHIDIQYHFIREKVNTGQIEVIYIQIEEMAADGLTKPLSKVKF